MRPPAPAPRLARPRSAVQRSAPRRVLPSGWACGLRGAAARLAPCRPAWPHGHAAPPPKKTCLHHHALTFPPLRPLARASVPSPSTPPRALFRPPSTSAQAELTACQHLLYDYFVRHLSTLSGPAGGAHAAGAAAKGGAGACAGAQPAHGAEDDEMAAACPRALSSPSCSPLETDSADAECAHVASLSAEAARRAEAEAGAHAAAGAGAPAAAALAGKPAAMSDIDVSVCESRKTPDNVIDIELAHGLPQRAQNLQQGPPAPHSDFTPIGQPMA